ncbi:23S rRNA (uracil-5-)-methyltransferase RumA [Oribacterium parvum ACB1]|uniref:23S rRNA (Uracil-5-)-methyltransferase RumA n=1 Tax=Oribacterium parvum ACB1 TaxID=796943 RepID=G9WPR4_9FIRM|nr:23S rRNA (uracil(1939)-C(5))-methyltransferase RlmD [Oribacterium parvum]EHL10347.1 23S rRNA (uracil-5-)-methyltransferase RumA [Oribacterium parvum ACB1]EJF12313.1 23S rRNA (uracil-5-)-methyltransferase RumA-like protein [Oribacterium parvum ACB8]
MQKIGKESNRESNQESNQEESLQSKERVQNTKSYKKNELIILEITDLTEEGQGVGKSDGLVFFVKDSVMGDLVEARILKVKKNYAYAKVEKLLKPSPYRITPLCPVAGKCGGCQLQHLSYEKELAWKEDRIAQSLIRIAGIPEEEVRKRGEGILGGKTVRYRNKAQYPVQNGKELHVETEQIGENSALDRKKKTAKNCIVDGKREGNINSMSVVRKELSGLKMGFYGFHSHRIIETEDCLINSEENPLILNCIKEWAREYQISGYEEETGKGLLRHIFLRKGFSTGEILLCLVLNGKSLPHGKELWERLQGLSLSAEEGDLQREADIPCGMDVQSGVDVRCGVDVHCGTDIPYGMDVQSKVNDHCWKNGTVQGRIVGLCVNINEGRDNAILGRETRCLYGKDSIEDKIGELSFSISVPSFYQVNPAQTEKIYGKALEYAALTGEETVWDCYCGIGTISLFLAQKAKQVYGLEIVPEAIENAKKNAEKNGLHNTEFYVGAAEEVLPKWVEEQKREGKDVGHLVDVVSLDPPRKGCDEACLSAVLELSPKRIVYVSCDPGSLARDMKYLRESGYVLEKWVGIDNFSRSGHVETIALLQKEES